jgi:MFS family permease
VISGLLIASFGMVPSFFINAISFGLVVLVLVIIDVARLHATGPAERKPRQVRECLSYIRQDRVLRLTVIAMSVVFVAAYNFQVMVPLLSSRILDGSSELYGVAMSSLGLGAVTGSLLIASRVKPGVMMVALCCGLLSAVHIWLALPFGVYFALAGTFLLGVSCGFFNVTVTSTLQLRARDDLRGRVMALYSIGILGSALFGAPLAGTLADAVGISDTFLIIAAVCASTAAITAWTWWKTGARIGERLTGHSAATASGMGVQK